MEEFGSVRGRCWSKAKALQFLMSAAVTVLTTRQFNASLKQSVNGGVKAGQRAGGRPGQFGRGRGPGLQEALVVFPVS